MGAFRRTWSSRAFAVGVALGVLHVLAELAIEEELRWTTRDD